MFKPFTYLRDTFQKIVQHRSAINTHDYPTPETTDKFVQPRNRKEKRYRISTTLRYLRQGKRAKKAYRRNRTGNGYTAGDVLTQ